MLKTLIVPSIILLIMLSVATYVGRSEVHLHGLAPIRDTCINQSASRSGRASDVLFVGSSRTGAAIDTSYIENRLKQKGYDLTVEQIIATGRDMTYLNLLSRKYIKNKGLPKHVFIEIIYNNRTAEQINSLHPEPSVRSILLSDYKLYNELLSDEPFNAPLNFIQKNYTSTIDYISTKYVSSLYLAAKRPEIFYTDYKKECENYDEWSHVLMDKDYGFIDGYLDDIFAGKTNHDCRYLLISPYDPQNKPEYCKKNHPIDFHENEILIVPRDPASPSRDHENLSVKALINLFLSSGSDTVTLYILPSFYDEVPSDEEKDDYMKEFNTPMIHVTDLYKSDKHKMLPFLYRDPNHYNVEGAKIITEHFEKEIIQRESKW